MIRSFRVGKKSTRIRRLSGVVLLTGAVLLSGIAAVFTLAPVTTVEATESGHSINMIAEAKLSDQHGDRVRLSDLENKLVLMNFFFTGCEGACPLQTAVLRDVQDELAAHTDEPDVVFLSVSIAPFSDTKEAIDDYIAHYKLDQAGWKFSTTDVKKLEKLIDHFGVTVDNAVVSDDQLDHRNMGYLFGKSGKLMQQYQLVPGVTERLAREITELDQLQL